MKKKLRRTNSSPESRVKPTPMVDKHIHRYCSCHRFIREWLARTENHSDEEVAAALLIHVLWESRSLTGEDGAIGIWLERSQFKSLGIPSPEKGMNALQRLQTVGIIKLHDS